MSKKFKASAESIITDTVDHTSVDNFSQNAESLQSDITSNSNTLPSQDRQPNMPLCFPANYSGKLMV